ncbi:MAG: YraN family protein [Rhodobacteraceae bacterium]|nr:YraN family protein [Paracoccaceae bacterium]
MSRGSTAYHNGVAAEDIALRLYEARGGVELARRWKTREGEIDLIVRLADVIIFVEVKARKTLATAAGAITEKQQLRLMNCANQYLAKYADLNTDCRFDLVMVDRQGVAEILENILAG